MLIVRLVTMFMLAIIFSSSLYACEKKLTRTVTLQPSDGESIDIASIELQKQKDGSYHYKLNVDDSKFSNHFLSMRPFKCFEGPKQMLCYLPYPYEKNNKISAEDLGNLEYDLLFIHRKSTDYGIDPWNGVYYKLEMDKDANLLGVLKEVDLDILAAPPEKGVTRPITDSALNEAEPSGHSYPTLVIK